MTKVFKDFKWDVLRIDFISSISIDNTKEWLDTMKILDLEATDTESENSIARQCKENQS